MEQVKGIEPSSRPWQGRILAVEPHLHFKYISNISNILMEIKINFIKLILYYFYLYHDIIKRIRGYKYEKAYERYKEENCKF